MRKLRLIFRHQVVDENSNLAGYEYATDIVEILITSPAFKFWNAHKNPPEVIAGEWLESEA